MPTCIRSAGVATAYVVMHTVMIVIVQVAPLALEAISWRFFLIFLVANVAFVGILYTFYPETKSKTLEEIGALFGDEVSRNTHSFKIEGRMLISPHVQVAETLEEAGLHFKEEKQQTQHIERPLP